MHVGLGLCFQALDGKVSDKDVYRFELGLAARAEGAGSIRSGPRSTTSPTTR